MSVVTPFHNSDDFLEDCINSVLAQTYGDWEYILVDNRSTDRSPEIAQKYAQRDRRVRYVRYEELIDQIPNYNRALTLLAPESRYCKVVQADDWIFPTCLEEMVRIAETHPSIGIVGSLSMYGDSVGHVGLPFSPTLMLPGREAARRFLLTDDGFIGSPTCVMYRSDLVRSRQPFFREACDSYEDVEACLDLLSRSDFGFAFQVLTYNRRNNHGFWSRIEGFAPVLLHLFILTEMYGPRVLEQEEYRQRSGDLHKRYYSMLASGVLGGKGPDFWAFHEDRLRRIDMTIDKGEFRSAVLEVLFDAALHPLSTARKFLRRRRNRGIARARENASGSDLQSDSQRT